jgi:hypothetical protein
VRTERTAEVGPSDCIERGFPVCLRDSHIGTSRATQVSGTMSGAATTADDRMANTSHTVSRAARNSSLGIPSQVGERPCEAWPLVCVASLVGPSMCGEQEPFSSGPGRARPMPSPRRENKSDRGTEPSQRDYSVLTRRSCQEFSSMAFGRICNQTLRAPNSPLGNS